MEQRGRIAKLTKRTVDATAPETTRYIVWDEVLKGFGLRVEPTGVKTFIIRYRSGVGGRSAPLRQLVLGRHGAITPDQARDKAQQLLASVKLGRDPARDRVRKRQEPTMSDVLDRYVAEHVTVHNKASTAAEARRQVERNIKPTLGRIKIGDLTRADIKRWHSSFSDRPYEGNRALAYLRKALALAAKDWEYRADNPALGIKMFPEAKRERFFSEAELQKIGTALASVEAEGRHTPGAARSVRLLALTGMRLGEVLGLRWEWVDLEAGCIRLPDAKAGARTVPLGTPTLAYLASLDRIGPFVCYGSEPEGAVGLKTFRRFWKKVSTVAGLANARPHDFRHTTGTYAGAAGLNAFMVRDILGHKTLAMTGRYVSRSADPMRAAADAVSGRVAAALDSRSAERQ